MLGTKGMWGLRRAWYPEQRRVGGERNGCLKRSGLECSVVGSLKNSNHKSEGGVIFSYSIRV